MTRELVHYWVVLFHPRTAAIRSLDSGLNVLFPYDVNFINNPPVLPIIPRGRHSLRSIPLHLTRSPHWICFSPPLPPPAPPLPLPLPSLPIILPIPTLNPSLGPPPPVPLPSSNRFTFGPTTAGTPSPPPSVWPAHRGPESVASQCTVQPCSASL